MKKSKPVGLMAAGRMTESALARLPLLVRTIGPIVAVNRRLASRYVNVLRAGWPGEPADLSDCRLIILQAKPAEWGGLLRRLPRGGCPVALLDDDFGAAMLAPLRAAGRAACSVAISPVAAQPLMLVDGDAGALRAVRGWASVGGVRCVEMKSRGKALYGAGMMTVSALVTPLVDAATRSLRQAGLSQVDAKQIVAQMLEGALRSYKAHGRKGWPNPSVAGRRAVVAAQCEALAGGDAGVGRLYGSVLAACLEYYGQETEWLSEFMRKELAQ
jgi:predicted short-subunit dehydrogenase-like oxidoreductase (DUF2520 family)